MFTSFSLSKSYLIPYEAIKYLKNILQQLQKTQKYKWLQKTNWRNLDYYYCYQMNTDNGILGAFSMFHPQCIYLMADSTMPPQEYFNQRLLGRGKQLKLVYNVCASMIAPTLLHQMYHRYQYVTRGFVLYGLSAIPGIRQLILQPKATEVGNEAEEDIKQVKELE